ncbi:MAG TPA: kelch repeat-containing protein [Candidatus Limnocylindrales bacterium]
MKITTLGAAVLTLVLVGCAAGPGASPTVLPTDIPPTQTSTSTGAPSATPTTSPSGEPSASPSASLSASPTATPTAATPAPDAYAWQELSASDGPPAREDHTLTLSSDGSAAFLFGGRAGNRTFDDVWRLDLASETWTQLSPEGAAPAGRFGHVAVWVDDLGLVIWSGQANASTFFDDIWAFDPGGLTWTQLPDGDSVPRARYGSCGAIGPDGRLWISHGFTADQARFHDTQAYDFDSGSWQDVTPAEGTPPVDRCLHDCLWTPDGQFVLYGGQTTGVPALGDLWALMGEPPASAWQQQPNPSAAARQLYALDKLDGRAFIFGGRDLDGDALADLWLLDLATLEMIEADPTGAAPAPRWGAAFVADPQRDRLVLFGGRDASGALSDTWQLSAQP